MIADQTSGTRVAANNQVYTVAGGKAVGGNLLHSFREFNIEAGETASFQAEPQTQQIISRVTGDNDSWINGTISIQGNKPIDLYLVNPHGIIFGKEASLDMQGALYASTADYMILQDGQQVFINPDQGVSLTVAAPEAFGFLDDSTGNIRIEGSQLSASTGTSIGLVAGDITLSSDARLIVAEGQIHMAAIASPGKGIHARINITDLSRENISTQETVLNNHQNRDIATTPVQSGTGGKIILENIQLSVQEDTAHSTDLENPKKAILRADLAVVLDNSQIDLNTTDGKNAGFVEIQAPEIRLTNHSAIISDTDGTGDGGLVLLRGSHQVLMDQSKIIVSTKSTADNAGGGGFVEIDAPMINLTHHSEILSESYGGGDGGHVLLKGTNMILLNKSNIDLEAHDKGMGGTLTIRTPVIKLAEDSKIIVDADGSGGGGYVSLTANNEVLLDNSKINMDVFDHGQGGELLIEAAEIKLTNGSVIQFDTDGSGQGGDVKLVADKLVLLNKSEIDLNADDKGAGGILEIKAPEIKLLNNTVIQVDASDKGKGGSVSLVADKLVMLDGGSGITALAHNSAGGDSGYVEIHAAEIKLTNGAFIQSDTHGTGKGGRVSLVADDLVQLVGKSGITLATLGTNNKVNEGQGGNLNIKAPVIVLNDSLIYAQTFGTGPGGSVTLIATDEIQLDGKETTISSASHGSGNSGMIKVESKSLSLRSGASIQATSGFDLTPPAWINTDSIPESISRTGTAGQIEIDLTGTLYLSHASRISTSTAGSGAAGDILIGTRKRPEHIILEDDSGIQSQSQSTAKKAGEAGQLNILAYKTIELRRNSTFNTDAENTGGGNITLETRDWLRLQNSRITTSVRSGSSQGGNIAIDPVFVLLESGEIKANADAGKGGNVSLVAEYLLSSGASVIEASSNKSVQGEVTVNAITVNSDSLLGRLGSIEPLDILPWIPPSCQALSQTNQLVINGLDAYPTPADDLLSAVTIKAGFLSAAQE